MFLSPQPQLTPKLPMQPGPNFLNILHQHRNNIQKLTWAQIQARREKGLCFYCDDKSVLVIKCRAATHVLTVSDSEVLMDVEETCLDRDTSYAHNEEQEANANKFACSDWYYRASNNSLQWYYC